MFKYPLVVLLVWCETAFAQNTSTQFFIIPNADNSNFSVITEELNKKPVIAINGNNNYNVAQQIINIYNEQQLEQILMSNKHSNVTGLTAHKLMPQRVTWNSARKACNREGGYLAIINSEAEEQLLLRLLKDNNISAAWLGVHDLYEEGEWLTVNGEFLEQTGYAKWTTKYGPGQPDNYGGDQNCGVLDTEGGMDDVECDLLYAFFCEKAA